jgi:peptide-methionine (S)-S-oxide reductase
LGGRSAVNKWREELMGKPIQRVVILAGIILAALFVLSTGRGARAASAAGELPDPIDGRALAPAGGEQVAIFAGGCFWGVEAVYRHVKGVVSATSGYAGGAKPASYDEVSTGSTGHAESVRVVYDPSKVSYAQLLKVFFAVAHDPTERNRQGPDVGTQYRSAIFYVDDDQKHAAQSYIAQLTATHSYPRPIVTEVAPLREFYAAEAYHQDYLIHHLNQAYIVINDLPKLDALKTQLPELYRP